MKWHELTVHGRQTLASEQAILERIQTVDAALHQLLIEIAVICGGDTAPLTRAVGLRSRIPHEAAEKGFISSRYEGLNQLIHYSYCLVAARRLYAVGCYRIQIIPCARDSRLGPDVSAVTKFKKTVTGEVFCVSPSLFRAKLRGVQKALRAHPGQLQFVLFNREVLQGKGYRSTSPDIAFYSYDAKTGDVSPEPRQLNPDRQIPDALGLSCNSRQLESSIEIP